MAKVSIIIPIYNQEKFLKRCLDSLIAQTLSDIEIICVNDGSTDSSAQILDEYVKNDNRIKVVTQLNSGVSEARNAGIKQATGEFIGYVDPDDFIDTDFYEKLYNSAVENNCDIACASVIRENNKKKKILIKYDKQSIAKTIKEKFELAHIPEHCYTCNKIYKTRLIKENTLMFLCGRTYEDLIYTPNVIELLGDMVVVPNIFYHYWKHPASIIKTASDKNRTDKIFAKKYLLEKLRKYNVKLSKKDSLICKKEFFLFGIKLLKTYIYPSTKEYYLFGLIPFLTVKEGV